MKLLTTQQNAPSVIGQHKGCRGGQKEGRIRESLVEEVLSGELCSKMLPGGKQAEDEKLGRVPHSLIAWVCSLVEAVRRAWRLNS